VEGGKPHYAEKHLPQTQPEHSLHKKRDISDIAIIFNKKLILKAA